MKAFGWTIGVLLILVALYALLMFFSQRKVAYPGVGRSILREAQVVPTGVEQIWLKTGFGSVEAWLLPAKTDMPAPTIIFAHGNYSLIDDWPEPTQQFVDLGVSVLLVEFPGYGHSQGKPNRKTFRETFGAAYDWLAAQPGVDKTRILAMGQSLGGGAATDLVTDRDIAGLILLSSFSSAKQLAWDAIHMPGVLVRDRFDNVAVIAQTDIPVLILHGKNDDIISYAHALALARARDGLEATLLDCGHNDTLRIWPEIVAALQAFLSQAGFLN